MSLTCIYNKVPSVDSSELRRPKGIQLNGIKLNRSTSPPALDSAKSTRPKLTSVTWYNKQHCTYSSLRPGQLAVISTSFCPPWIQPLSGRHGFNLLTSSSSKWSNFRSFKWFTFYYFELDGRCMLIVPLANQFNHSESKKVWFSTRENPISANFTPLIYVVYYS